MAKFKDLLDATMKEYERTFFIKGYSEEEKTSTNFIDFVKKVMNRLKENKDNIKEKFTKAFQNKIGNYLEKDKDEKPIQEDNKYLITKSNFMSLFFTIVEKVDDVWKDPDKKQGEKRKLFNDLLFKQYKDVVIFLITSEGKERVKIAK